MEMRHPGTKKKPYASKPVSDVSKEEKAGPDLVLTPLSTRGGSRIRLVPSVAD